MKKSRLDKFLSSKLNVNRKSIRLLLAQNKVLVNGVIATDTDLIINKFSHIQLEDAVIQNNTPSYIMLNKPIGVVSATKDEQHKTVLDLLHDKHHPNKDELHIVGRLDLNTSGLVLLTNNSNWSERLTQPNKKVAKRYRVTLKNSLSLDYVVAFQQGMYFEYEDIITKPALLEIESEYVAIVTLTEGKYHQIKRMFGRFRNPVLKLHRLSVGGLVLDDNLALGESRNLSTFEVNLALSVLK